MPKTFSVIQKYYPDNNEHHLYAIIINIYSKEPKKQQKEKLFFSTNMYDGVVIDEGNHDFDVPKYRLKMIINCYNT